MAENSVKTISAHAAESPVQDILPEALIGQAQPELLPIASRTEQSLLHKTGEIVLLVLGYPLVHFEDMRIKHKAHNPKWKD